MVLTPLTVTLWAVFAVFATAALVARARGRVRLGLGVRRPPPGRELAAGAAIGAVAIAALFAGELFSGRVDVHEVAVDPAGLAIAGAFFVPFALFEEIALRGLLLVGVLVVTRRAWLAVTVSAVVFALAHVPNPDATVLSAVSAGLGGVMYALAFVRTGRLWMPIALHLAWNVTQALLGFPVSGITDHSQVLVTQEHGGPEWLTGGAYGPEGGLLGYAARLLVIVLIMLATAHRPATPVLVTPRVTVGSP